MERSIWWDILEDGWIVPGVHNLLHGLIRNWENEIKWQILVRF